MTAVVAREASTAPARFASSILRGVPPSQYAILYWVTREPDIESAVQTTPPMSRTWSMPLSPRRPSAERATAVTISVVRVIPEIGVIEIIAIAQAETAAKRKAITRARLVEARAREVADGSAARTERRKYRKIASAVAAMPTSTADIGRPRSAR